MDARAWELVPAASSDVPLIIVAIFRCLLSSFSCFLSLVFNASGLSSL